MKAEGGKRVVSPARRAAFDILRRVEEEGAYATPLLASSEKSLGREDRALAYELVLGVLRRQLWLDHLIEHYAGRNPLSLDGPVRRALRLGLYQLRFLSRIPASAIVNESVNLAYRARLRSAAPFINAVLRRATREPDFDPAAGIKDPVQKLAVESSHPVWMIERWVRMFGRDDAEKFALANNETPPVAFRVGARDAAEDEVLEELRAAGANLMPSQIAPGAWRIQGATAALQRLARAGRIYLQDEASQLVAHVVAARAGERVLDVCAAPGSKATHIASLAPDLSMVVAGDLHEHRVRTVINASERQGIKSLRALVHNAEQALPFAAATFDRVLVDAPCTGTGTLRRNPEIRWRIGADDIEELAARQGRILARSARTVHPGGRLVYSTCSVEPEENEEVVMGFLKENSDFRLVLADALVGIQRADGTARTWPHRQGTDGFFIAAFERRV